MINFSYAPKLAVSTTCLFVLDSLRIALLLNIKLGWARVILLTLCCRINECLVLLLKRSKLWDKHFLHLKQLFLDRNLHVLELFYFRHLRNLRQLWSRYRLRNCMSRSSLRWHINLLYNYMCCSHYFILRKVSIELLYPPGTITVFAAICSFKAPLLLHELGSTLIAIELLLWHYLLNSLSW